MKKGGNNNITDSAILMVANEQIFFSYRPWQDVTIIEYYKKSSVSFNWVLITCENNC